MIVDRTSWVTNAADKTPVIYRLDTQLLIPLYDDRLNFNIRFFEFYFSEIQWVEQAYVVVVH